MKLYLLILLQAIKLVFAEHLPLVKTPYGEIQGTYSKSYKGQTYSQFLGVPYAQPPVGKLRFKEPQPLQKWSGVWNANISTQCIQVNHHPEPEGGNLIGQEDCLYLNIFVPSENPNNKDLFNVIVHIHSGAFNSGFGNGYAGPKYLMDIDVILVTMNYRLGALGFLSTEDEVVPGNNGMKDQAESLKWVKNNIKFFGGNPDSITITGLAAGGASVHYHYLSPLSEGLFNRGISVSGTALTPWSFQEGALEKAKKVGTSLGCSQESTLEMVECLRQRPAEQIVDSVRMFRPWLYNPFSPFGVVREVAGDKPFLSENPYEMIAKGKVRDLPWLTSVTSEVGLYPAGDFMLKDNYLPDLERRWSELASAVLDYNYTIPLEKHESVADSAKKHYLKGKPISKDTYNELVQMLGDRHFVVPAEKAARLQASVNKSPVFFYYFSYTNSEAKYGISHWDDMMYILSIPFRTITKMTNRDEAVKDIVLGIWSSFAQTGIPKLNNTEWTPLSKSADGELMYLHIKSPEDLKMQTTKDLGHGSFWKTIPFAENENLMPIKD